MELYKKLKRMRILLIDDDEWVRDSMTLYFKEEGCSVLALETAEEGLKAIRKELYDIIFVDYRLPGMDGLEFLDVVQNICRHSIKILITAYTESKIVLEAKQVGVHAVINKPFTTEIIETTLSKFIC